MSTSVNSERNWVWSQAKEQAALEVARDRLTDEEIAAQARVTRGGFAKWKTCPEFMERVSEHRAAIRERICTTGYASIERRVEKLSELLDRYNAIMDARAEELEEVPGGATGLIVRTYKVIGSGANARTVEEYAFDRALSAEIRATLDDIAREVGGRVNRTDITAGGEPFKVYLSAEVDHV